MNQPSTIQWIILAITCVGTIVTVLAFRRAGQWKETDDARSWVSRLGTVEFKVGNLESAFAHTPTKADIAKLEERMLNTATKADVATLQSDVRALSREIGNVDDGVTRIESFLMKDTK